MFRFTVRDLMWLTLVVALALGWLVREWQFRDDTKWQRAFDGLQYAIMLEGYDASVDFDSSSVRLSNDRMTIEKDIGSRSSLINITFPKPLD
jgi:hypothetical protein